MQILVIAPAFILLALTVVEVRGSDNCTRPLCFDKCSQLDGFPGDKCKNLQYISYGVCSFACSCDNGFFGYMQVPDTTPCGNNKVCLTGVCSDLATDVNCKKYGHCYVPVYDPTTPCAYKCVHKNGCAIYEENKKSGVCCYNSKCLRTGKCDNKGICTVEGGQGCSKTSHMLMGANQNAAATSSSSGNNNAGGSGGASSTTSAGASSTTSADKSKVEKAVQKLADEGKELCEISALLGDNPEPCNFTPKLHKYISNKKDAVTAGLVCSAVSSVCDKKKNKDCYMVSIIIVTHLHEYGITENACVSAATKITDCLCKKEKKLTLENFKEEFQKSFKKDGKNAGKIAYLSYTIYKNSCNSTSASS